MSITKSDLRTRTLQIADAVASSRWDYTANGEVDQHIGMVMDREWRRILNAQRFYNTQRLTITSDASGYYQISDLTTGLASPSVLTNDGAKRFYRVLAFAVDSIVYEEVEMDQYLLPGTTSPQPQYVWYFEGQQINALPTQASHAAICVVNWIPPRQEQLSADSIVIQFPDGYENIIAWSAASKLLTSRGASEAARGQVLELQAEALRQDMLQDLARRSTNPIRMRYHDSSWDYGG